MKINTLKKQIAGHLAMEALAYCLVSPALVWCESRLVGMDAALTQVVPLTVGSTVFFALSLVTFALYHALVSQGGKSLVGFYLGSKLLYLLLTLGSLVIYGVASGPQIVLFAVNLMVLYMVYLVNSSLLYAAVERKLKHK